MKTKQEVINGLRKLVIKEENEHAVTLGVKGLEDVCITVWIDDVLSKDEAKQHAKMLEISYDMLEAMQEFCERVERGEIRSKRTYAKFKKLINSATTI